MLKKIKSLMALGRLSEELIYEQVYKEIESGIKLGGIWAKALANAKGSLDRAESLYIKYRVQSIKDEIQVSNPKAIKYETQSTSNHYLDDVPAVPSLEPEPSITASLTEAEIENVHEIAASLDSRGISLTSTPTGWYLFNQNTKTERFIKSYDELVAFAEYY